MQRISLGTLLFLRSLLHGIHLRGNFADAFGGLLHQVVHDGVTLVVGLLHADHHVLHLLHLGLQGDDVFVDGECVGGGGQQQERKPKVQKLEKNYACDTRSKRKLRLNSGSKKSVRQVGGVFQNPRQHLQVNDPCKCCRLLMIRERMCDIVAATGNLY